MRRTQRACGERLQARWLRQRESYRLRFALDGRRVSKGLHKPSHTGGLSRARQLQGNLLVLVTCLNREWGQGGGPPSRYALRRDSLRLSGEFARWLASRSLGSERLVGPPSPLRGLRRTASARADWRSSAGTRFGALSAGPAVARRQASEGWRREWDSNPR